jgi:rubrerythrin
MVARKQLEDLVLQSLEHEKGGVQVYETALKCAIDDDLTEEWQEYLEQTKHHVEIVEQLCQALGIDTTQEVPSQAIVRHLGLALVDAMEMALTDGKLDAAQLVACECVVLAETKDHLNWELLSKCAEKLKGDEARAVKDACEEVEEEEDEHLYHTQGWCRELWIASLGMKAVLPPPEEQKHVKTAIGAARAQQESERQR